MKLRSSYSAIRNIGIAAHIDAGKTTLTERILFYAGAIHHCGDVHNGDTAMDFDSLEKSKGITISSAAAPCAWTQKAEADVAKLFAGERHQFNVIDTPGHVDFTAEVERSLRVLDGAIAVFCGVGGVQPQSETVWRQMDRYRVPRIAFINKMDRAGADFDRVVHEMRSRLGANACAVILPLGAEDDLRGQLDLINLRLLVAVENGAYTVEEIPAVALDSANAARLQLVAAVADLDEAVADLVLRDAPVPPEILKQAIRRLTIAGKMIPVIGGSAYRHIGVAALVDAVIDYLPAPEEADRLPSPKPLLAALAFKVVRHPLAGRLGGWCGLEGGNRWTLLRV